MRIKTDFFASVEFIYLFLAFIVLCAALTYIIMLLRRHHLVYQVENGRGVAGVKIVILNTKTGQTIETVTNRSGYFWAHLTRGQYKIAIIRASDLDPYEIEMIDYHDELKPVEGGYFFALNGSFENLRFGVR